MSDSSVTLFNAIKDHNERLMSQWLEQRPADLHAQRTQGDAPLHIAARSGSLDCFKRLMALGAKPEDLNTKGQNALHQACMGRCLPIVEILMQQPELLTIDFLSQQDEKGYTPLHYALSHPNLEIVNLLLDQNERHTHPHLAKGQHTDPHEPDGRYGDDLQAETKDILPVDPLSALGAVERVEALVDLKRRTHLKDTPLHMAAITVAYGGMGDGGNPPDLFATLSRMITQSLYQGLDINTPNTTLKTPLLSMVGRIEPDHGHLDIVDALISQGAHLHAKDLGGNTPLHLATYRGHLPLVQLLVQKGADPKATNREDLTPVAFAAYSLSDDAQAAIDYLTGCLLAQEEQTILSEALDSLSNPSAQDPGQSPGAVDEAVSKPRKSI